MASGPVPIPRDVPTIVTGARDPGTTVSQRIKADVKDEIVLYRPSAAPFQVLTRALRKKREVTQYAFDILEKDEFPRTSELDADATSSGTSLTLKSGHGGRVAANYVLQNTRTGEQVLVTAVSTDTLTVVRNISDVGSGQDMLAGDTLDFLRPVFADGADIGTLKSVKESRIYNYTENIRTQYGFTGRQMNTSMYGGMDPDTERKAQGIEHAKSIEKALWFGKRYSRTGSTGLQTFTGGFFYWVQSNIWDLNGQKPTERGFVEYLEFAMALGKGGNDDGSATKYLFASRRWITEIEFWARDRIRIVDAGEAAGKKRLGLKLGFFDTAHGTVVIVMEPIFDGPNADKAALVDMNHIRYAYHQGRNTKLLEDRGGNGVDGETEEYLTDCGLDIELEPAHGVLKGLPL